MLYTPWRVKAPSNVAASERLLFYLLLLVVVILMASSAKVLREGCGRLEWPGLRLLKMGMRNICEGICSVVLWMTARHDGWLKRKEVKLGVTGRSESLVLF